MAWTDTSGPCEKTGPRKNIKPYKVWPNEHKHIWSRRKQIRGSSARPAQVTHAQPSQDRVRASPTRESQQHIKQAEGRRGTRCCATQALQVVPSASLTSLSGVAAIATPRSTDPAADTPRITAAQDTPPVELSPTLLGTLQQMITSAIREQLTVLAPAQVTTQPEVAVLGQADPTLAMPRPEAVSGPTNPLPAQIGDVPPQWLARLESLQKGLQDVNTRKHRTELSLFSIRQKEGESLKDYLQRFNTAALEVPSATQEVKASTFAQGLMDGDFFKSLAKKPTIEFDVLLARAAKYINMEDAQASKREGRGEKRKENKDENPSKKPKMDFKDKKPA
ncbi:UNVERIFIED_CONTAM: hypothetical protein Slati_2116800 [Sesamum latifolium]|uniref:Retrotransposon gag domain-containing protein n=1 Tax=Sesamum latifolium TaxID=2727402 RepID=A0AAW2WTB0_9LAMI